MNKKEHWENVFTTKTEKEVSWYQAYPQTSVDFFAALQLPKDAKIIDVGGGDSYFIDALLDLGYTQLTLLDISGKAIERIKKRLGEKAAHVTFIESDILDFNPIEHYDFWHDRACFHFLTEAAQIEQYADIVDKALTKGGRMFIGAFSDKGPKKCSGLEIKQYNMESLRFVFEKEFQLKGCFTEDHITPFDTVQNFIFCGFKRKA
ncbi:class I SAM-dependent methyltransferase [Flavobacterium phycosphaerae]|uniref:class I SAM-dependent methyltransferase n=1 Tax=Flavobacterium phycosphaerae TaxID=2697515 RepID=UPI00192E9096|nr:class I SAM-dependent methyltransferase [Flavobacterium phycosphaerae]